MSAISAKDHVGSNVYSATNDGTKADATTDTSVLIWGWNCRNTTGAAAYVQVFDAQSANVTVGTTTPKFAIGMAASGLSEAYLSKPIQLKTGFTVAATTTRGGATGAATDVNFFFTSNP